MNHRQHFITSEGRCARRAVSLQIWGVRPPPRCGGGGGERRFLAQVPQPHTGTEHRGSQESVEKPTNIFE